jgi:large subunit ribosomal protein L21
MGYSAETMAKIAIIETGGKQHLVTEGSVYTIEKLKGSHKAGDALVFDKVLLIDDGSSTKVGAPYIDGAKVSAELVSEGREKKVTVIHYRQKSRYFKKAGHRQPFAKVKITGLP